MIKNKTFLMSLSIAIALLKVIFLYGFLNGDTYKTGFIFINVDEGQYTYRAYDLYLGIKNYGLWYTIENYYQYSQSLHALYYYIIALFIFIFDDNYIFSFVLFKITIVFVVTVRLLYSFLNRYSTCRVAFVGTLFFIIYVPLHYYNFSLMRDDFILLFLLAFMCSINNFIDNRNIVNLLLLLLSLFILFQLRFTMPILGFFIIVALNFKEKLKAVSLKTVCFCFCFCFFLLYPIQLYFDFSISDFLSKILNTPNIIFEIVKLYFSPLPWNLAGAYRPLIIWCWFSFLSSFVLLLCPKQLAKSLYENKYFFIVVIFLYFIPYVTRDGYVGFRQLMILSPLLFPFFCERVINRIKWPC